MISIDAAKDEALLLELEAVPERNIAKDSSVLWNLLDRTANEELWEWIQYPHSGKQSVASSLFTFFESRQNVRMSE